MLVMLAYIDRLMQFKHNLTFLYLVRL